MRFVLGLMVSASILFLLGCKKEADLVLAPNLTSYSFFVAGHTYGKPGVDNIGFHPPLRDKLGLLSNDEFIELGVLTGDIVLSSTVKNWDEVDEDISLIGKPVYFAAGNHDIGNRPLFESRYGKTYFSFIHNTDLFIILDPNIDNWNISGDQLVFLKNVLNENALNASNIFVFFHQVLWWEPNNIFKDFSVNSLEGRADTINFWSEIEPLFTSLSNKVYMFAGDVGAFNNDDEFMYYAYDNITLIASGMGGGKRDNIVLVDILEDQTVEFRLIALNGDNEYALGVLEDYELPSK